MTNEQLYKIFKQYPLISTDSRKIQKDSLFFALRGDNFDGNSYAIQALNDGARYAITDEISLQNMPGCIHVQNVLTTLQSLASLHRKSFKIPVIGITGSNGKTTTKELTAATLSKKYRVWYTHGNLNNHIGVPLTILSMPKNTEIAVIEMGANHKGEINTLCKIASPDFGLITNVAKAHLAGFGSLEGVMEAKSELYQFIQKNGGLCFLNSDNPNLKKMINDAKYVSYGSSSTALITGRNPKASPFLEFEWCNNNTKTIYKTSTKLIGSYNLENAMAAICIATYFNVPDYLIDAALKEYVPQNNRSQLINTRHNTVLLDAYNANPESMKLALKNFNEMDAQNKVLILGEMNELGQNSQQEHKTILKQIERMQFDKCFLTGKEFEPFTETYKHYKWYKSMGELYSYLQTNPISQKLILLKGSRSNKLETLLEVL